MTPCAVIGRGRRFFAVREHSCLLPDESSGAVVREQSISRRVGDSSGSVVREQSSVRRVGVSGRRHVPKTAVVDVFFRRPHVWLLLEFELAFFFEEDEERFLVFRAPAGATGA